jgi:preprotein translocase subunit SecD
VRRETERTPCGVRLPGWTKTESPKRMISSTALLRIELVPTGRRRAAHGLA